MSFYYRCESAKCGVVFEQEQKFAFVSCQVCNAAARICEHINDYTGLPTPKGVADSPGGALKADTGKIPVHLFPPEAVFEISKVLAFGAQKYAEHNWRKGMNWSRLIRAALGHLLWWSIGEDKDPESGLSHLSHAGCCIVFLITYEAKSLGSDDRWKP